MLRDYLQLPRTVHILCLGMLINRAGSFFLIFLTIYASEELDFGIRFATLAMGVLGAGSMAGAMTGGYLADQIGRRPVMLTALFGGAATLIILSFTRQRIPFLLVTFLFAFVSDMYRPAGSAMISDLVPPEKRQYSFGLLYVSINLGFAIAPPLGGMLADLSFQWLFWGDAITTALFGLIAVVFVGETLPDNLTDSGSNEPKPSVLQSARHIARDSTFLLFCLASLLNATVFMQGMSTLPIVMTGYGFSKTEFGQVIALNGILIVAAQLPLTNWLSGYNRMLVMAAGGLLITIGFGLNMFGTSLQFIAFTVVVWTIGEMFQAPFQQAIVTDLAPAQYRGRYLGLLSVCYALALSIGAPLGGAILESYGVEALWKACCCIGLSAVVVYAVIQPRVRMRSES